VVQLEGAQQPPSEAWQCASLSWWMYSAHEGREGAMAYLSQREGLRGNGGKADDFRQPENPAFQGRDVRVREVWGLPSTCLRSGLHWKKAVDSDHTVMVSHLRCSMESRQRLGYSTKQTVTAARNEEPQLPEGEEVHPLL